MKINHRMKGFTALLLVALLAVGFSGCHGQKKEAATTTTAPSTTQTTTAAPVAAVETITDGEKTVVYPTELKEAQHSYPVIAWSNGTGMNTQSYTALLEEFAKGGYIVVADNDSMAADGTSQRDSIDYILKLNGNASSPLYQKVNVDAIGVSGHSQGGRSCINAAQADKRIKCVVSIAGASSEAESDGLKTPCLFLTGTNDIIVSSSKWCKPSYDAVAGSAAYASLDGGIHTTCMISPKKVSGYALQWFDAYLKNDKKAKAVFKEDGKLAHDTEWRDFESKNM